MTIGALVVGLGRIGMGFDMDLDPEAHVLTHARAFQKHPRFRLIGGVDEDWSRCRMFQEHYGCPAFADLKKALQAMRPEVVAIATPTPLHAENLRTVLEFSEPKAILCEKPLSSDIGQAREMTGMCLRHSCKLYVNYIRRSDLGMLEVKRRLDANLIEKPVKGVAWYSKGLFHNGSHFFNLLQFWLGPMKRFKIIEAGRLWDGADPEPDMLVEFDRGTMMFLAAREECFSHYTVELVAPNGRLRVEHGGESIRWQPTQGDPVADGYTVLSSLAEKIETGMTHYQWHVADQLALSIDGTRANLCTGAEALETLSSLHEIKAAL